MVRGQSLLVVGPRRLDLFFSRCNGSWSGMVPVANARIPEPFQLEEPR